MKLSSRPQVIDMHNLNNQFLYIRCIKVNLLNRSLLVIPEEAHEKTPIGSQPIAP
jgi:hypothetical protein